MSLATVRLLQAMMSPLPRARTLKLEQRWELVDRLYANWRAFLPSAVAFTGICAICYAASHYICYLVLGVAQLAILAVRLWSTHWYWRTRDRRYALHNDVATVHRATWYFVTGISATGSCWSVACAFTIAWPHDPVLIAYTLAGAVGWVSGSVAAYSASPAANTMLIFAGFLPVMPAALISPYHELRYVILIAIFFLLGNFVVAHQLGRQITALLQSRAAQKSLNAQLHFSNRELVSVNDKLEQTNQLLAAANTQLALQAQTDGLTQIANRRWLDDRLHDAWHRSRREQADMALLLIDVDHFKNYNDHYGHLTGDECLRTVAQQIAAQMRRPQDVAARYGGEEFAALLPDIARDGAAELAERLRAAIENLRVPHAASPTGPVVTVSVGLAFLGPSADLTVADLVTRADQALYLAKRQGRNRVCQYQAETARSVA